MNFFLFKKENIYKYIYNILIFIFIFFSLTEKSFSVNCNAFVNSILIFGDYNPTLSGSYETKTSLKIICKPEGPRGLATIRVKTATDSGNGEIRIMKNSKNEIMKFSLYQDPKYSRIIDNNTILLRITDIFNTEKSYEIPIYGKIFPYQNIGVGNYQMNLPIILEWNSGPN